MSLVFLALALFLPFTASEASAGPAATAAPVVVEAFKASLNPRRFSALGTNPSLEAMAEAMTSQEKAGARTRLIRIEQEAHDPETLRAIATGYRLLGFPDDMARAAHRLGQLAPNGPRASELARAAFSLKKIQENRSAPHPDLTRLRDPFGRRSPEDGRIGNATRYQPMEGSRSDGTLPIKPTLPSRYARPSAVPAPSVSSSRGDPGRRSPLPLAAGLAAVGVAAAVGLRKKDDLQHAPAAGAPPVDWKSLAKNFAVGVGAGVVAAAAVTGLAVGAAAVGVPALIVTGALGVLAIAGGAYTIYNVVDKVKKRDWNGVSFAAGSIVGGIIVGAAGGGRLIADRVSSSPSTVPRSWNPLADLPWHYNPNYPGGSLVTWLGSGPTPQSGGGTAAMAGSGASQWLKSHWLSR